MDSTHSIDKVYHEIERKVVNLMLQHTEVVEEMIERNVGVDFFSPRHQPLVQAIYYNAHMSEGKRLLSDKHYRTMLIEQGGKGDVMIPMEVYSNCLYGVPASNTKEDLDLLLKQLTEAYVHRKGTSSLGKFTENAAKMGYLGATKQFIEDLQCVVNLTEAKKSVFLTLDEKKDEYIENLQKKRDNPEERLTCKIPEIDEAMNVGFKPGHTSLFIAATGGNKTNMMINIALQIYKTSGKQILFIPLEMDWEDFVTRLVSNVAEISYTKLLNPGLLSSEEMEKIKECQLWFYKNFGVIDVDERISVSSIRMELEKRINYFKPAVVVVDYLSLLSLDNQNSFRHDLALGELTKTLKFMGKKYGFHIITAAQLGRADIKRIREEGADARLDSTAVKDSQEIASNAEFIFALTAVPGEENRLKLHVVKSRYGPHGYTKELHLNANFCKISGTELPTLSDGTPDFLDDDGLSVPMEVIHKDLEKKELEWSTGTVDELDDIG